MERQTRTGGGLQSWVAGHRIGRIKLDHLSSELDQIYDSNEEIYSSCTGRQPLAGTQCRPLID
jgi:hypothetical protein